MQNPTSTESQRPIWKQVKDEGPKAYAAFVYYREMPPEERSISKVAAKCSKSVSLLNRWSAKFDWVKRASAYDTELEEVRETARATEIQHVMSEGYANTHERVRALNETALQLEKMLKSPKNIWLRDVKQVGPKECPEIIELVRFNTPLFDQYRGTLDDLAKETGGRIRRVDATNTVVLKQYIGLEELLGESTEATSQDKEAAQGENE